MVSKGLTTSVRVSAHATIAVRDKIPRFVVSMKQEASPDLLAEKVNITIQGEDPNLLRLLPLGDKLTLKLVAEQVELPTAT
jgi:hypothetical protein